MLNVNEELKNLIPPLSDEEREQLTENLLTEGIRDAIVIGVVDGEKYIVDGHNRYEIATEYDLEYETKEIEFPSFESMKDWMIKNQLGRRNINSYMRTELALLLKPKFVAQAKENIANREAVGGKSIDTREEIAKLAGVGTNTVDRVEEIQKKADEETIQKVRDGEISINEAFRATREAERQEKRKEQREQQKENIDEFVDIFNTDKKYRVIYADPPWKYNQSSSDTRMGFAEAHYETMSLDELRRLPVKDIAEKDSVLFLWATNPLLPDAIELMWSWGFEYKSAFVWHKGNSGLGYYNRVVHEFLLIGTRGKCTPDTDKRIPSVQEIPKGEHSAKPEEFRKIIEEMYIGEKLELFARKIPEGWDAWGNEIIV